MTITSAQRPDSDMEAVCKLLGIEEFLPETRLVILLNAEVYAIFTLAARLHHEVRRLEFDLDEARAETRMTEGRLDRHLADDQGLDGHGPGYD
jgi:hypothetical protein